MGADGAATLGTIFGQNTALQPVRKLCNHADKLIIGTSGPIGIGQRVVGMISQMWDERKFGGEVVSYQAMQLVREKIGPMLALELKYAQEVAKVLGPGIAQQNSVSSAMLAVPVAREVQLYSFGCTGDPEQSTDDLPFMTTGSGQSLADPFLAFLRAVFWKQRRRPTTGDGIFATYWALRHAIRTNTGGVSDPIQMMTLQKDDRGNFHVKELDSAELEETKQAVDAAESHLSGFDFEQAESSTPPSAPTQTS